MFALWVATGDHGKKFGQIIPVHQVLHIPSATASTRSTSSISLRKPSMLYFFTPLPGTPRRCCVFPSGSQPVSAE